MDELAEQLDLILREANSLVDLSITGEDIEVPAESELIIAKLLTLKRFLAAADTSINDQLKALSAKNPQKAGFAGDYIRLVVAPKVSYEVDEKTDERFVTLTPSPNKEKIEAFIKLTGKLPEGVTRRTSLAITKKLL